MNKFVKISDIFNVHYGINLELVHLTECNKTDYNAIPFVSRTEKNNGVSAFVEKEIEIPPNPAHTLSVAGGGSVLSTFYQPIPYYSGRDIYILIPKKEMSVIEMLAYSKYISANKFRYNYGRQANKTLKDLLIPKKIPSDLISKLKKYYDKINSQISPKPDINEKIKLNTENWKSFNLIDLFEIKGSKTTPLLELQEYGIGRYPYVTTQATNNGVEGFYDFFTEEGNVLTIDSAVVGYCAYQKLPFSASDHVEKLIPKFEMNDYVALFFTTILNLEQYRFNYGRKASQTRLKKIKIKLPEKNEKPDFEFMEKYIKSLPYSSSINIIEHNTVPNNAQN